MGSRARGATTKWINSKQPGKLQITKIEKDAAIHCANTVHRQLEDSGCRYKLVNVLVRFQNHTRKGKILLYDSSKGKYKVGESINSPIGYFSRNDITVLDTESDFFKFQYKPESSD